MKKIVRDKQRVKQTGEVFTPLPLVDEILGKLDESVWSPEKTMIDNSCGDGNFLIRVIAWKIWKGSTAKQALETTYGVDLMPDNILVARERVLIAAHEAMLWHKQSNPLMEPLTHTEEHNVQVACPQYAKFAHKYEYIVDRNIVCHDALTYDYSFEDNS